MSERGNSVIAAINKTLGSGWVVQISVISGILLLPASALWNSMLEFFPDNELVDSTIAITFPVNSRKWGEDIIYPYIVHTRTI